MDMAFPNNPNASNYSGIVHLPEGVTVLRILQVFVRIAAV